MFLPCLLVFLASTSCTDIRLAMYRDDAFLEQHRYALGEQHIDMDGLRLCYQETGSGETVLILPGLGTSIDFWQLNIPALATAHHVVALDLPGFGKSDKPNASYELRWICDRVIAFMNAKRLRRVSIIGGSLGGHLGLLLALEHPERVRRLVLMGSTGAWPEPNYLLNAGIKLFWNDWTVAHYLRSQWPDIFPKLFQRETELTRSLFRYQMAVRAVAARYASQGRASSRVLRSIFYTTCRDRLGEIRIPVLLVWGQHDQIHPVEDGLYMASQLPDAQLVIVPDAGHEAMIDQPEFFNETVLAFLRSSGPAALEPPAPESPE